MDSVIFRTSLSIAQRSALVIRRTDDQRVATPGDPAITYSGDRLGIIDRSPRCAPWCDGIRRGFALPIVMAVVRVCGCCAPTALMHEHGDGYRLSAILV